MEFKTKIDDKNLLAALETAHERYNGQQANVPGGGRPLVDVNAFVSHAIIEMATNIARQLAAEKISAAVQSASLEELLAIEKKVRAAGATNSIATQDGKGLNGIKPPAPPARVSLRQGALAR